MVAVRKMKTFFMAKKDNLIQLGHIHPPFRNRLFSQCPTQCVIVLGGLLMAVMLNFTSCTRQKGYDAVLDMADFNCLNHLPKRRRKWRRRSKCDGSCY